MSIKLKTILAIVFCFFVFALVILYISDRAYQKNIEFFAQNSINEARKSFINLEANDIKMLSATLEALLNNDPVKNAFIKRDRKKLIDLTWPLFEKLEKKFSITHFYFIDPPPDSKCFLRVHRPELFDDKINRTTYLNSTKSGTFGTGLELGKTAFALRVVHPVYNNGVLAGYMELGEEIEHFLAIMKSQTKNDFGLLVRKDKLDANEWSVMRKNSNLSDNWENMKNVVLIANTTQNENIIHYNGDLDGLSDKGEVLENIKQGKNVFVRGLFPIYDADSNRIGAIFVLHDITGIYNTLRATQIAIILIIIVMGIFMSLVIILMLQKFIFARLQSITEIATRIVGGDYDCSMKAYNDDEIGKFESLFEQFRMVFVNTIKQLSDKVNGNK